MSFVMVGDAKLFLYANQHKLNHRNVCVEHRVFFLTNLLVINGGRP